MHSSIGPELPRPTTSLRSTARHARRPITLGLLTLLSLTVVSCTPCQDLQERLCTDLGAGCGTWRARNLGTTWLKPPHSGLRGRRFRLAFMSPEADVCRAYAKSDVYAAYTLPFARYLVASVETPAQRPTPPTVPARLMQGPLDGLMIWSPLVLVAASGLFMVWRLKRGR